MLRLWSVPQAPPPPAESWELPRPGAACRQVVTANQHTAQSRQGDPWPTTSTSCCWHCCHTFDGPPIPLPVAYCSYTDTFRVIGNFCSFACARAYNVDNRRNHVSTMHYVTLLRKRATGQLGHTRTAPPRTSLSMFGGALTIEEFRASGRESHAVSFAGVRLLSAEQLTAAPPPPLSLAARGPDDSGLPAPEADAMFEETTAGEVVRRPKGRPRKKQAAAEEPPAAKAMAPNHLRLKKTSFLPSQGTLDMFLGKKSCDTA